MNTISATSASSASSQSLVQLQPLSALEEYLCHSGGPPGPTETSTLKRCAGSSQLGLPGYQDRASLHACAANPRRFPGPPESLKWETVGFTQLGPQAHPANSLG